MPSVAFGAVLGIVCLAWTTPAAPAHDAAQEPSQYGIVKKSRKSAERAYGREGDPRKAVRTIRITMSDAMRYFPDQIRVKRGDTIRFAVRNSGELPHEMVIGTMDDLRKHAALMKSGRDVPHDGANVARVAPGTTGRIVWHFTRPGEFYYGCLIPGHFEAGMIGTIVVR
jgi:uncharacterized cupredoxin-like copper-binding protein